MELNERNIKEAKPGEVLRDAKIKGLHLRAFTKGKGFYLYYRTKAGIERKPKLGDYGSITLSQARGVAQEMLAQVALGKDPSKTRSDSKNEPTMQDLWDEYWKRHGSKKKSSSADECRWRLHIQPRLGKLKLSEVDYGQIADLHASISKAKAKSPTETEENAKGKRRKTTGTPTGANRVLSLLSKMFNFAHRPLEWVDKNPAKGVQRNPEVKRRRYMKGEEAAKIAAILDASANNSPASVAFLYLLILTGARKGEIANAKWEWIKGNVLSLPDSKTGEKNIYLPQAALDVLAKLPRTKGTITGILTPQKLWQRVRKEAGCPDLRMHDLRHSFASAAIAAGLSLAQIGELLGHSSTQTTKRYAHLVDEVATAAATLTADRIMAGMNKTPLVA